MPRVNGLDGRSRDLNAENLINSQAAATFGTPAGRAFLDYLRSITVNTASGPEVNINALIHLEGQRFLVGLIASRIAQGHKEKRNAPSEKPNV